MPIITGSENPDVLVGTLGDDTIVALSGDDSVVAGRGDNIIFGNQGNDILRAGRGQDTLLGGRDNDQLFGNEQNNILSGDIGDDTLFAVDGENFLFGNDGGDVLVAGLGNDFLYGGQANDTIWAERGNNVVSGDRGADVLIGGTGENIFVININQGGPEIADAEQILRFKPNDKLALVGGPDGQTLDKSAINIAFVRTDANSTRGNYVLSNLATGEFLAVIRNVRRSALTDESFTEEIVPSDTPDPGPPQPPEVDPEDELPPAPDPGDTTTDPQPPPTPGPGTPPVVEPPVDEDDPDDPGTGGEEPGDGDDPGTGTGDDGSGDDGSGDDGSGDPDNRPPTVSGASITLGQAESVTEQLTGTDPDDDSITFELDGSGPQFGRLDLNEETGVYTYTPRSDFQGKDEFLFIARDEFGKESEESAKIELDVTPSSSPILDLNVEEIGTFTATVTFVENQSGRFEIFGDGSNQLKFDNLYLWGGDKGLRQFGMQLSPIPNNGPSNATKTEEIQITDDNDNFAIEKGPTSGAGPWSGATNAHRVILSPKDADRLNITEVKDSLKTLTYINVNDTDGNSRSDRLTDEDREIRFRFSETDDNLNGPDVILTLNIDENKPPEIEDLAGTLDVNDNENKELFTGVSISDQQTQDNEEEVDITITLNPNTGDAGEFIGLEDGWDVSGDEYKFTGKPEDAEDAVQALTFQPAKDEVEVGQTQTVTITLQVDDRLNDIVEATTEVMSLSINDAPTFVESTGPVVPIKSIQATNQDHGGVLVQDILKDDSNDPIIDDDDKDSKEGIAVTEVTGDGTWQYKQSDTDTWSSIASIPGGHGLLLAADAETKVRFVPNENFDADLPAPNIEFRAWDQTGEPTAGDIIELGAGGEISPFSAEDDVQNATVEVITLKANSDTVNVTSNIDFIPVSALLANDDGETISIDNVTGATLGGDRITGWSIGDSSFTYTITDGSETSEAATVNVNLINPASGEIRGVNGEINILQGTGDNQTIIGSDGDDTLMPGGTDQTLDLSDGGRDVIRYRNFADRNFGGEVEGFDPLTDRIVFDDGTNTYFDLSNFGGSLSGVTVVNSLGAGGTDISSGDILIWQSIDTQRAYNFSEIDATINAQLGANNRPAIVVYPRMLDGNIVPYVVLDFKLDGAGSGENDRMGITPLVINNPDTDLPAASNTYNNFVANFTVDTFDII